MEVPNLYYCFASFSVEKKNETKGKSLVKMITTII